MDNKILRKILTVSSIAMLYSFTQGAIAKPNTAEHLEQLLSSEVSNALRYTIHISLKDNPTGGKQKITPQMCEKTYTSMAALLISATEVIANFSCEVSGNYIKNFFNICAHFLDGKNGVNCSNGLKVVNTLPATNIMPTEITLYDAYKWNLMKHSYQHICADKSFPLYGKNGCLSSLSFEVASGYDDLFCDKITEKIKEHNRDASDKECLTIDPELFENCKYNDQ